ncbi:MAG: tetraacyldisaccharide 4'-kinase [Ferrovum sp. 34-44-207]|nr:MAG: tetraacyldisaccharide 4'-kinase [Ferrovum sp. 34-44-207]
MSQQWFLDIWYSQRVNWLFVPLSGLFRFLINIRTWLYTYGFIKSHALPVPVLVVGNITVGGTGKTPLVISLCQWLKEKGFQPGVITRGYQGQIKDVALIKEGDGASLVGDEPLLIFQEAKVPVAVGKDRYLAGLELLKEYPEIDIVLSDDGLQHYRLQRDMEIVVIDGLRELGNEYLLPAGPLREPKSRLNSVDAVIVNGATQQHTFTHQCLFTMQLVADYWVNVKDISLIEEANLFTDQPCYVTCAIGNPGRFMQTLHLLNIEVLNTRFFEDHHAYQEKDLQGWDQHKILMTEKDGIKCKTFAPSNAWMLKVHAHVDKAFYQWLEAKLSQWRVKHGS